MLAGGVCERGGVSATTTAGDKVTGVVSLLSMDGRGAVIDRDRVAFTVEGAKGVGGASSSAWVKGVRAAPKPRCVDNLPLSPLPTWVPTSAFPGTAGRSTAGVAAICRVDASSKCS